MEPYLDLYIGEETSTPEESIRQAVLTVDRDRPTASTGPLSRLRAKIFGRRSGRIEVTELIEALHRVAAASADGQEIDDALVAIADQAKAITNTDKAILCLIDLDEVGSPRVDAESVVARGSRDELPESWWAGHVERMSDEVLSTRTVVTYRDRREGAWIACAPAPSRGGPVAILCAINSGWRSFTRDETNFLGILGAFAGSAIENARLAEQAKHSLLVGERDRISREMHDGLAQSLFSASLGLEVAGKLVPKDPEKAVERVSEVQRVINDSMGELRHYIYDLRAPRLERLGLVKAVQAYMDTVAKDATTHSELIVRGRERQLEDSAEACLYRVAREAVTNSIRHAECKRLDVIIEFSKSDVVLTVRDDGLGFDVRGAFRSATRRGSLGLRNIRDRARAAGGEAEIASSLRGGTNVRVRVPC